MPIPAGDGLLVSVDEFSTYLNNPGLDPVRATFILHLAQTLCESIVLPLPDAARVVVLDVAERAFANPTATRDSALGLYAEGEGPFASGSNGLVGGGLYLTENNKQMLRQLAGRGGAFTVDTLAASYKPTIPVWDTGATWSGTWDTPR